MLLLLSLSALISLVFCSYSNLGQVS